MASQPINPKTQSPFRPNHLPPPTILPLRHCSHNQDDTPIDETSCLLSLFSPSPDNPDSKKNKEHYILATADPPAPEKIASSGGAGGGDGKKRKREVEEAEEKMRRAKMLRIKARAVPGVPVVYVKRSVMILEPMSGSSEDVREGVERGKFRAGIEGDSSLGKRKRVEDGKNRKGGVKKAKGPNPLSVKKSKRVGESEKQSGGKKEVGNDPKDGAVSVSEQQDESSKPKRKRRHKSAKQDAPETETETAEAVE